jgi:ABC-type multidrug transport system ATPase subunit
MVIATADIEAVEVLCHRVLVLDAGRVVTRSPTRDLLDDLAPMTYIIDVEPGPGLALGGLLARLAREPWVREVDAVGGTLRVAVVDAGRAGRELLPVVVATGLRVLAVRRERPTVEALVARLRGTVA